MVDGTRRIKNRTGLSGAGPHGCTKAVAASGRHALSRVLTAIAARLRATEGIVVAENDGLMTYAHFIYSYSSLD